MHGLAGIRGAACVAEAARLDRESAEGATATGGRDFEGCRGRDSNPHSPEATSPSTLAAQLREPASRPSHLVVGPGGPSRLRPRRHGVRASGGGH